MPLTCNKKRLNKNSDCPGLYHITQAGDGGLCRVRLEQGRIQPEQLHRVAELARTHGNSIIEFTSRANIQLRGIASTRERGIIRALEEVGLAPKTPKGDGVRNIMVNPTAGFDRQGHDGIVALAQELSACLQIHPRYQTLSPKFSIFLDGGEACAFIHHFHDIWLSLCDEGTNFAFGLAFRPPLVEEIRKAIPAALGKVPFDAAKKLVFTLIDFLLEMRDKHEKVERMKHVLAIQEPTMIFDVLKQKLPLIQPAQDFHRPHPEANTYLGSHRTKQEGCFYLGIKPPLGGGTPEMAHFIADTAQAFIVKDMRLTPWQGIIFPNISSLQAKSMKAVFKRAGFITDGDEALAQIVCCTGLPGCRSAKSAVRLDALRLAEMLKDTNFPPLHLTGCAKSCAINEARAITLVATAPYLYDLFMVDEAACAPFGRLIARSVTIKQVSEKLSHL